MLKSTDSSNTIIIVLHEIYGINQHIKLVCENYSKAGFVVSCPDLINRNRPFNYDQEMEAYQYFMKNVGIVPAAAQAKELLKEARSRYKRVFLLGYSIGATIAWLCSNETDLCNGVVGYYGSRIRDYLDITPKCPALLIFPTEEHSFNTQRLIPILKQKQNADLRILNGKHGFSDPFSKNYHEPSAREATILTADFLNSLII